MSVFLHGLGHFHPENEITNAFLEELDIETSDSWIMERVGIRTRRTVLDLGYVRETRNVDPRQTDEACLYTNAEMGRRAAEMAIQRAGISKHEIGMVLSGCSAPYMSSPAESAIVANLMQLDVPVFDVNSACTSLFAQFYVVSLMDPEKLPPYLLLVGPESLTRTVNYNDRASAVLWGDGAAAAVISTHQKGRAEILGSLLESNPTGWDNVVVPRAGHFSQRGRTVQTFAIKKTIREVKRLRESYAQEGRNFNFIGHQANLPMLENVCRQCEIPPERHHFNVDRYGNTGCASAASVVSMNWDRWVPEDDIAMAGVGSGLTWSGYLIRFGDA